ncbi:MAG: SRPBCC family protein [Candidatus Falkowbacteria bacterium]|nr:SRPBCC family protein [Candidatus Falkowbacteria bacterium]
MTRIEKSVVIEAPLEKVFNFTANMSNLKRYFVYVTEIIPIDHDIIKKGAKYNLKVKFLGRLRDSEWECVEYDDKSGWKINATLMGVTAVKQWKFYKTNGSTKVIFTMNYKPSPPVIGNLLDLFLWQIYCFQSFLNIFIFLQYAI